MVLLSLMGQGKHRVAQVLPFLVNYSHGRVQANDQLDGGCTVEEHISTLMKTTARLHSLGNLLNSERVSG